MVSHILAKDISERIEQLRHSHYESKSLKIEGGKIQVPTQDDIHCVAQVLAAPHVQTPYIWWKEMLWRSYDRLMLNGRSYDRVEKRMARYIDWCVDRREHAWFWQYPGRPSQEIIYGKFRFSAPVVHSMERKRLGVDFMDEIGELIRKNQGVGIIYDGKLRVFASGERGGQRGGQRHEGCYESDERCHIYGLITDH